MPHDDCRDSGSTMERFMEMSIGLAMGRQMAEAMGQTMDKTVSQNPAREASPAGQGQNRLYYAAIDGRQAGPFSETELVRLINDKKIVRETLVWHQGMAQWKAAQDVPEILRIITLAPPPLA
jgi:hypothetical protein